MSSETSPLIEALLSGKPPNRPALRTPAGETLRYGELMGMGFRLATALRASGVEKGDRVSFRLDRIPEVIALCHACWRLGALIHPLNDAYTDAELASLLADAAPRLIVCRPGEAVQLEAHGRGVGARLHTLTAKEGGSLGDAGRSLPPNASSVPCVADEGAALLYTSGTTGKPKGAQITHGNLASSAVALGRVWSIVPDDVLIHALPLFHAHGLLTAANAMLAAGSQILLMPSFDAAEFVGALPQATIIMAVPTMYGRIAKEVGLRQASRRLRLAISGSAPLPETVAQTFHDQSGVEIIERYGMTEAGIIAAIPAGTTQRCGWVGWPLPGVEVRLRGGVLQTRGDNVFKGYWRQPGADRDAFTADGWLVTGDLADIDAQGCIRILGRQKDLIISGGLNVYPGEVEAVLAALPDVGAAAVFGVPHPDFGEAVVAVVETSGDERDFDEASLVAAMRRRLAPYKTPKRLLAVDAIPRNRLGKIRKDLLRATYRDLFAVETSSAVCIRKGEQ